MIKYDMLLVWVGFDTKQFCGCRGGYRRVARQQGGSTVSSSLCTGCCCHDDQCQSVQACSGTTLAWLPPCLCCWYLSRVCYLGSLLCIHAMITTTVLVDWIFNAPVGPKCHVCAHHLSKVMQLCLRLHTCAILRVHWPQHLLPFAWSYQ